MAITSRNEIKQVSSASDLAGILGGRPLGGGGYMCHCPAHGDANPSLHVSDGHSTVVYSCKAGCSNEEVTAALKSDGIWIVDRWKQRDFERQQHERQTQKEQKQKTENAFDIYRASRYPYDDKNERRKLPARYLERRGITHVPPSATVLMPEKAKEYLNIATPVMLLPVYGGNGFQAIHATFLNRDGSGKADIKSPKQFRGPFSGGYAVLAALDDDKPLIIGEGAENALSASQLCGDLPCIAALTAGNLPNIDPPKCSEIIVAADNDEPGQKGAVGLAQKLVAEERKVVIRIATPPDEFKGWNDVLLAYRGKPKALERLRHDILNAELFDGPGSKVTALSARDFMDPSFPDRKLHLSPWLPTQSICMIHAPRGEGKTWLILSVAFAVSRGEGLLGWKCEQPGRVLYVDGELPGKLLQKRLAWFGEMPENLLILNRDMFHRFHKLMPDLTTAAGRKELDRIIVDQQTDVIMLDSLSTLVRTGVENEAESWAPIGDWMMEHRWQGRSFVMAHHDGRNGLPRGTSKREDILDTIIGLKVRRPKLGEELGKTTTFDLVYGKHRDFYGEDAAPMVLHLDTSSGSVNWSHEAAADDQRTKVRKLLADGWKQKDVAKELGVTESWISQLKG